MSDVNLNVKISCVCGDLLPATTQLTLDDDGSQVITVPPCERCLADARHDERALNESGQPEANK